MSGYGFISVPRSLELYAQHDEWKFYFNGPCGTVLSASPAMPAFGRVPDVNFIVFYKNDIQRTMFITNATKIAFAQINDRWHGALLSLYDYLNHFLYTPILKRCIKEIQLKKTYWELFEPWIEINTWTVHWMTQRDVETLWKKGTAFFP